MESWTSKSIDEFHRVGILLLIFFLLESELEREAEAVLVGPVKRGERLLGMESQWNLKPRMKLWHDRYLINIDKLNCHPILIKICLKVTAGGVPMVITSNILL